MHGKYMTAGCAALGLALLLAASPAKADDISLLKEEIRKQQELLKQQQDAMKGLQQRLHDLEGRQKTVEGTQKDLVERAKNVEEAIASDHEMEMQTFQDLRSKFGANLSAFGSINYSSRSRSQGHNSYSLGDLVLYSTGSYGDRLTFMAEIDVEAEEAETEIELERIWVGYTFNDLLSVKAGKHNSALGYWNRVYHQGKQLYTTVDRPFFLKSEFEGSIMPLHIIGLELEGSVKHDVGRLKYDLEVGNGPGIHSTKKMHPNDSGDSDNTKQVILRLSGSPTKVPGLDFGIFGTTYTVKTAAKKHLRESVTGAYLSYLHSNVELIAEYFRLQNNRKGADAFYVQLGYTIKQAFTPYFRYEYLYGAGNDPYFNELEVVPNRRQFLAGVKYDIEPLRSSLKFQYRNDKEKGSKTNNVFETQWSFNF